MFYRLVSGGIVLDAVSDESAAWIVENPHNYSTYTGGKEKAKGILSSDGNTVYQIAGKEKFHDFDYIEVTMEEISEEEYRAIREDLEAGRIIAEEAVPELDGADEQPEPVTLLRMIQSKVDELMAEREQQPEQADNTLEGSRRAKIEEMSAACNAAIIAGFDIGPAHYSLTVEDQLNLISLQAMIAMGQQTVPYHADGEECRYYTSEEFSEIVDAATRWKLYHESYFNNLKAWINQIEDARDINGIRYGDPIPDEYITDVMRGLME